MSNHRFLAVFCCIFLIPAFQMAQSGSKLELMLSALEQDPDLKYATLGFCAIDIVQNKIVAQRNPNTALIPASALKVVSTGTAVAILGENYKFKTFLQHDGTIEKGVLKGNLYIKGTGDPSLGSPVMEGVMTMENLLAAWVEAIQKAGITRIEGSIIGDGTYFEQMGVISTWQWGDVGNYYGAGAYGLNIHDNMYFITYQQNSKVGGSPTIVKTHPELPQFAISSEVKSGASGTGDNAYIYAAPYGNQAFINGTIPAGSGTFQIKGAIPNPPLFTAQILLQYLKAAGIEAKKGASFLTVPPSSSAVRQTLYTYTSPPLSEIVKHTNEDSRNLYCEVMIKAIGLQQKAAPTTEMGLAAVLDFWRERGVETQGFFMMDGSGLSARNGISAKALSQIMRKMYVDKDAFGDFYNLLAIAGQTGTLANIGKGTAAAGNIRAKSGSINRVRSYTGFVTTTKGTALAFTVIVNNYTCSGSIMRKKLEQLMITMAEL